LAWVFMSIAACLADGVSVILIEDDTGTIRLSPFREAL
jgi:hypothetical protein